MRDSGVAMVQEYQPRPGRVSGCMGRGGGSSTSAAAFDTCFVVFVRGACRDGTLGQWVRRRTASMKIVGWLAKFRVGICLGRFGIVGKVIGRGITSSPLGCLLLLFAVLGLQFDIYV